MRRRRSRWWVTAVSVPVQRRRANQKVVSILRIRSIYTGNGADRGGGGRQPDGGTRTRWPEHPAWPRGRRPARRPAGGGQLLGAGPWRVGRAVRRSEERRVGKECRSRWS